jgi:beta-ureidopropionase
MSLRTMARTVKGGLIQVANAKSEGTVKEICNAMLEKTLPFVEKAGKAGVQMLCLQEVFNTPYFCPAQTPNWYDAAEACPGPLTNLLSEYAKKHSMVIVVPLYEREMAGVYYNTAAVIDADGKYLGKYRKQHIPQTSGFWEKYYFKPGNLGYPVFRTQYGVVGVYICYDRTQWRTATSSAPSTASAPRRRGTSASSTARRTSWTRAARSSRRAARTRTSSSSPT